MSAHHAPDWVPARHGTGIKHDGIFATWLSLLSFTFLIGTFVGANVYLRGWNPEKFNVELGTNLPAITTLILIFAGFLTVIAGSFYKQGAWKKLQGTMVLASIAFSGYAVMTVKLLTHTYSIGPAAWTTHLGIYFLQLLLALVCIGFIAAIGFAFAERNEKALNAYVPAAMSVFLYTVMTGILILVVTDMISIGEFAEWCGTRVGVIK